jgi:hypothetical protein
VAGNDLAYCGNRWNLHRLAQRPKEVAEEKGKDRSLPFSPSLLALFLRRWALHRFAVNYNFLAGLLALAGVGDGVLLTCQGDGGERCYGESGSGDSGEQFHHDVFPRLV